MWGSVAVVVLGGRPGDDVGAVVRARASILAEVELDKLNLQQRGRGKRGEGIKQKRKREREEGKGGGGDVFWGS